MAKTAGRQSLPLRLLILAAVFAFHIVQFLLHSGVFTPRGVDFTLDEPAAGKRIIKHDYSYSPSIMESYVMLHGRSKRMGYDKEPVDKGDRRILFGMPSGCSLYFDEEVSDNDFRARAKTLRSSLKDYKRLQSEWSWNLNTEPSTSGGPNDGSSSNNNNSTTAATATQKRDLRDYLDADGTNRGVVCDSLELHETGMAGIFPEDNLSRVRLVSPGVRINNDNHNALTTTSDQIFLEPLLPPLRHPEFCYGITTDIKKNRYLLDWSYIVHDFAGMCRHRLRNKHARTVFVDMGASLSFHDNSAPPVLVLLELYAKFGFVFDHIYGFEMTKQDPADVYRLIPDDLKAAYHWYNVGVVTNLSSYQNPFRLLLEKFRPDDFVVVKLDIDSAAIENPIANQLLEDPRLAELVDVFYYEHHVGVHEMRKPWKGSMVGSMQSSLEFFTKLRSKGIAAHYWI